MRKLSLFSVATILAIIVLAAVFVVWPAVNSRLNYSSPTEAPVWLTSGPAPVRDMHEVTPEMRRRQIRVKARTATSLRPIPPYYTPYTINKPSVAAVDNEAWVLKFMHPGEVVVCGFPSGPSCRLYVVEE